MHKSSALFIFFTPLPREGWEILEFPCLETPPFVGELFRAPPPPPTGQGRLPVSGHRERGRGALVPGAEKGRYLMAGVVRADGGDPCPVPWKGAWCLPGICQPRVQHESSGK